ncbi:LysR family transcriptional regulator [Rhodococcus zopfii]|uniref:LysR family transcriptional regulator n=1 Tax=Rhodococcus zopfii TaxID=43772 RepID=UPI00093499DA|nr:LysR family transcriptional regulator [Rhodococcus zopfii]
MAFDRTPGTAGARHPRPRPGSAEALLDLYRIKQFVAVAKHLNFTRAAEELHLSQQAVSGTIKSLERELGIALFHRIGGRVELTPSGAALRDGAVPLLQAAGSLARTISAAQYARPSTFTLAHTPEIDCEEVLDLLPDLRRLATRTG